MTNSDMQTLLSFDAATFDLDSIGPAVLDSKLEELETLLVRDGRLRPVLGGQRISWLAKGAAHKAFRDRLRFADGRPYSAFLTAIEPFEERLHLLGVQQQNVQIALRKRRRGKSAGHFELPMATPDIGAIKRVRDGVHGRFKAAWFACLNEARVLVSTRDGLHEALVRPGDSSQSRALRYIFSREVIAAMREPGATDRPRPKSKRGFANVDEPLIVEALALLGSGAALNPSQATDQVIADPARLAGGGTPESKRDRIYRAVLARWERECRTDENSH